MTLQVDAVTARSSAFAEWERNLAHADPVSVDAAADQFAARGYAVVPFVTTPAMTVTIAEELERLIATVGVRRDFLMAGTCDTPRRMKNVRRDQVRQGSTVLPELYGVPALRSLLSRIAREPVHLCPYEPEQYVITTLEEGGDTHGWHWDDYAFALVWVAECPPIDDGGFVQCVPRTVWDRKNPRIYSQMASSVIHTISLRRGDVYFMRTDTTLAPGGAHLPRPSHDHQHGVRKHHQPG
jgi:hypothetical protein